MFSKRRVKGKSGRLVTDDSVTQYFSVAGTLLASGSDDLMIVVWNWIQNRPALIYDSGHRSNVFQVSIVSRAQFPYLKFPKDSVQLRITPKKILCGVLGHLLRSNFFLKNGKQSEECVNLYDYHHIWNELRTFVTSGVLG